jgi:hypothetical protein
MFRRTVNLSESKHTTVILTKITIFRTLTKLRYHYDFDKLAVKFKYALRVSKTKDTRDQDNKPGLPGRFLLFLGGGASS